MSSSARVHGHSSPSTPVACGQDPGLSSWPQVLVEHSHSAYPVAPAVEGSWSCPGTWLWPCDSSCLGAVQVRVHGLADRVRDGVLLVVLRRLRLCEHAAQVPAVRSDDNGLLCLQFIDRVGYCSYATVTGILLVQTVQKTVEIPLCSSLARLFRQCCPVEVPLLQYIESRRHPCCGAEASLGFFGREPITQVVSSRKPVSVTDVASQMFCGHQAVSETTTTTIIQSGEVRFHRRGAPTPTLGS